jgi:hypothetical protein
MKEEIVFKGFNIVPSKLTWAGGAGHSSRYLDNIVYFNKEISKLVLVDTIKFSMTRLDKDNTKNR